MGLASSMGLGIALAKPERQVVVFDGDLDDYARWPKLQYAANDAQAIVITGNDKAFSGGADVKEFGTPNAARPRPAKRHLPRIYNVSFSEIGEAQRQAGRRCGGDEQVVAPRIEAALEDVGALSHQAKLWFAELLRDGVIADFDADSLPALWAAAMFSQSPRPTEIKRVLQVCTQVSAVGGHTKMFSQNFSRSR